MDSRASGEGLRVPSPTGQVIVVPRNGYANRLQAWASAHVLAAQLNWDLKVLWEPQEVATTPVDWIFGEEFLARTLISSSEVQAILGRSHEELPRYFNVLREGDLLVLAGHDKGEQAFMPDLARHLTLGQIGTTLVIIAGGSYSLPDSPDPVAARRAFYRSLMWSESVDNLVNEAVKSQRDFCALHVRNTDRSHQAPTNRAIRQALQEAAERSDSKSLFVCADTHEARVQWSTVAEDIGWSPWYVTGVEFDRTSPANGVSALVDWRLLSLASSVIFPAASTFSSEAVVAGGNIDTSYPLATHTLRGKLRSKARKFFCLLDNLKSTSFSK